VQEGVERGGKKSEGKGGKRALSPVLKK